MDNVQTKARFDWLVELSGAIAPGLAAGFVALRLAQSSGHPSAVATSVSAAAFFGVGLVAMRAVKPESREHALAEFSIKPIETDEEPLLLDTPYEEPLLLDTLHEEALLLDRPYEEPLLLEDVAGDEPLLLDDALSGPDPASRIVQLFASQPMPTPGQLKERIDRHLASGSMHVVHEHEGPAPDASDALYAALAELRQSLR